jgi:DNA polymerase-1
MKARRELKTLLSVNPYPTSSPPDISIILLGTNMELAPRFNYLSPTEDSWVCDIEADGLLDKATTIWCATLANVITREEISCVSKEEFLAFKRDHPAAVYIGHNFISYDAVMLNRFWGAGIGMNAIIDTFVLSQLYNPSYAKPAGCSKGPHSLEAWGIRLGYPKGDFDDFSEFTPEMLKYCRRDTRLTALLYLRLTDRMRQVGFSNTGAWIEHLSWNIIQNQQKKNGFPFNEKAAMLLSADLRKREDELKQEIYELWPPEFVVVKEYTGARKKNGEFSKQYERHLGQYPKVELYGENEYRCWDWIEFNLGSPPQRIEKLLELGWQPTNWNVNKKTKEKTSPKVDEDELLAFAELSGQPEVKALAKWVVVNSRANMVQTWLNAYNPDTGCIHGSLFLASTLRYKHSGPNSANIPAVRTKKDAEGNEYVAYGEEGTWAYECRDLWTSGGDGWTLVGIDGTGIQNRCLIHGLVKTVGEDVVRPFKELALEGDVHKKNIAVLGLANKPAAKKFYYTLMMGGGGARLAADQAQFGTVMTAKEGEAKKNALIASIPGFHDLIGALKAELEKKGRIKLCDDTPIIVTSPHMVIPYLLQGDESRLMKLAMILVNNEIRKRGWVGKVLKVADIHDEWQYRVRDEIVEEFIVAALPCFRAAGELFKYNIPIDGDAKPGKTWAETH